MGCDIHLHVEVKICGKWYHYNHPYISRNYNMFCLMAGVRRYTDSPLPISLPRGLPKDISDTTKFDRSYYGENGHSDSWLTAEEAGVVQRYVEDLDKTKYWHPPVFGYLFGNNIDSYVRYPKDGGYLTSMGYEDARIVFWFDN